MGDVTTTAAAAIVAETAAHDDVAALAVVKRDGTRQALDAAKVATSVRKALATVEPEGEGGGAHEATIGAVTAAVVAGVRAGEVAPGVEAIQDAVERQLMAAGAYAAAKHYILYRLQRTARRAAHGYAPKQRADDAPAPTTPWGPLGYVTYKRTYARADAEGVTEEFEDTVRRVLEACQTQLGVGFTQAELDAAFRHFMGLKASVAGRFLWQLGTATVGRLGLASLQNCAFTAIDHPVRPFVWIFDFLMLGAGCGFSVQREHVAKLPPVLDRAVAVTRRDTKDADFIVPDSREGWVSLLEHVLEAFFVRGRGFTYSTVLLRGAGTRIEGFGGVASGPEALCVGIAHICDLLTRRRGERLSSVDCLDLVNIIASVVVSGNVRRCLPGGALVHARRGLVPIRDVTPGADEVLTAGGYRAVAARVAQGRQLLLEVATRDGVLRCTPAHRVAVLADGATSTYVWRAARDLKPGDRLLSPRVAVEGDPERACLPTPDGHGDDVEEDAEVDADVAWLLGAVQTAGCVEEDGASANEDAGAVWVRVPAGEPGVALAVARQLRRVGRWLLLGGESRDADGASGGEDATVRAHGDGEGDGGGGGGCVRVSCDPACARALAGYLARHAPLGDAAPPPACVLAAPPAVRLAYIAGCCAVTAPPGGALLGLATASEARARALQALAYSCGVEMRVTAAAAAEGGGRMWRVEAVTAHAVTALASVPQPVRLARAAAPPPERWDWDGEDGAPWHAARVVEVRPAPDGGDEGEETYDLEVADRHEFFADGYLVHNSALLAIGDPDDLEYLAAKRWDLGHIPNWRAMSNNSVACEDVAQLPDAFWEGYRGNGEPYGLINLRLARAVGRLRDGGKYPDPEVRGFNPCVPGGTLVLTREGLRPAHALVGRPFEAVLDGAAHASTVAGFVRTRERAEVWRLTLDNGAVVRATPDHRFRTLPDGAWVPLRDLVPGASRVALTHGGVPGGTTAWTGGTGTRDAGWALGRRLGEMTARDCDGSDGCGASGADDEGHHRASRRRITTAGAWDGATHGRSRAFVTGVVQGVLAARGRVEPAAGGVTAAFACAVTARRLQLLLGALGVRASVVLGGAGDSSGATVRVAPSDAAALRSTVGFSDAARRAALDEVVAAVEREVGGDADGGEWAAGVAAVEREAEPEDVYDCTVPGPDAFGADGVLAHNCAEQGLAKWETCCLAELFLPNLASFEEAVQVATSVYRICKHSLLLPCHAEETADAVHRNMRMGIGVTGYLQATEAQRGWLPALYDRLRAFDAEYSARLGCPPSIKLTTCKPSGTLSLLAGVTPGVHPAIYRHFIRRIRISAGNPLVALCREHGYHVEFQRNFDGTDDRSTFVVEFPCAFPEGVVLAADTSAVAQLEWVRRVQTDWSDNAVSVTVYYRAHELPAIRAWLAAHYRDCVKTVSFLLHTDHGFAQAPYEEISAERYAELTARVRPITRGRIDTDDTDAGAAECAGGACPIK